MSEDELLLRKPSYRYSPEPESDEQVAPQEPHSWLKRLELEESTLDSLPVKSSRRTWDKTSFVFFWITDSFNINTVQLASTGLLNGALSAKEVILSILLGYTIVGLFIHISARIGAYSHVPFPVACRLSFGRRGAAWPVLNRVMVGAVWYSVQCWIGGQCVQLIVKLVAYGLFSDDEGNNRGNWGDHFSFEMTSFGVFCILSFFVILVPPERLNPFLTLKACVVPIAAVFILVWVYLRASFGASNPIERPFLMPEDGPNLRLWTFIGSTMNCVANFATLILNASDFSRFARSPSSMEWVNIVSIPVCFTLTSALGIAISRALFKIYGVSYWSPLDVLDRFLADASSYGWFLQILVRLGVMSIASLFVVAQIGTNIANSLSAATGLSCMFPRYVSLKRGGIICALFLLVIRPWQFFESSNNFTVYLSSYSVFLSGISGVILADYYVVRRGSVELPDLYRKGLYSYPESKWLESNWRAYLAYLVSVIPNLPGFLAACGGVRALGIGGVLYEFSFFTGFLVGAAAYILLCIIRKSEGMGLKGWREEWKNVDGILLGEY